MINLSVTMTSLHRLPHKPDARSETVETLVGRVLRGLIRVPSFQRGLRWDRSDVAALFDSLYRGYPIGSLLFYKRPSQAERLEVGPLTIDAEESGEAWWVVDGQQRLTALAACLARPEPLPSRPSEHDPFVLYFDPEQQTFEPPPAKGEVMSTWVPLPRLLDSSQLSEWVFGWPHGDDERLRKVVFEAGSRIREYAIPLYLIEPEAGSEVAEQIYVRVNMSGKALEWTDVHMALFGRDGSFPATLPELAEELREVGMGKLDENRLLTGLIALRGKDPTKTLLDHHRRDPDFLRDAIQESLPVLRRVLSFLRADAEIPHLRLLPKSILLDILIRFFALHPDPGPRSRLLLTRWFWRTVLGAGAFEDRTLRRRGISAVNADEEESVQRLLRLVWNERPRPLELPASFDARADESRIALLSMVHMQPRSLLDERPIDPAAVIEENDKKAFLKIVDRVPSASTRSPANRLIHTPRIQIRKLLLERIDYHGFDDPVLGSHAIDSEAAEALSSGDLEGFLDARGIKLVTAMQRFTDRLAAWGYNDRPSVDHLLAHAEISP